MFPGASTTDGCACARRLRCRRPLTGPGPYVVLHPGASVPARAWSPSAPPRPYANSPPPDTACWSTGGPDAWMADDTSAGRHRTDLGGSAADAPELAGCPRGRGSSVVTGNTAPAHPVGRPAVGTPVVSLFAPVVPAERWRPYGVPYVLLGDQDAPCADSRARDCPVPGHPCL
ncbi:ADP-heptose:LPS heptosyltransferase OS=Streptomyces griseomycini OX=66895 GN=FHS37_002859 PE=4 SV=1 [Streptomyces griseomycini]